MKMSKSFRSKWKPILYIFIGLKISSCSSEESQEFNENQKEKEIVTQQTTLKELGYDSHKDMMNDEWKLLIPKNNKGKFSIQNNTKNTELKKINEKITVNHLSQLGYYYFGGGKLLDLYAKYYSPSPRKISVNDYQTTIAWKETTISNKYGWEAYIKSGEPKIVEQVSDTLYNDILESTWVFNESHTQEDRGNLSYSITTSKTTYWENTGSLAVSVGKEIGIPGLKGKIDITMGYSHTEGRSEAVSETFNYSYWVTLPPRTKRQIIIRKKVINETIKCEIPIAITGYIGAEFRSRETGDLHMALPANLLLKNKPKAMTYTIGIKSKGNIEVYGGPELPL